MSAARAYEYAKKGERSFVYGKLVFFALYIILVFLLDKYWSAVNILSMFKIHFNSSETSKSIMNIVIICIGILTISITISLFISINLKTFSTFINTSGQIRGGIQQTTKLYLAAEEISQKIEHIDSLFTTLTSFQNTNRSLIKINKQEQFLELFKKWNNYKKIIENQTSTNDEIITQSEVIWELSTAVVKSIENQTHSYIRILFFISMLTIIVILLLFITILIIKFIIQDRIEKQASFDNLTGLLNRNHLEYLYNKKIKESKSTLENIAVLLLDIDHFKKINDTFGHDVGDTVLKGIAGSIKNCSRDSDLIFRYGGEEFLLFTSYKHVSDLIKFAERIREIIEVEKYIESAITISIGVALVTDKLSMKEIIVHADTALYQAKENGRNQVVFYNTAH